MNILTLFILVKGTLANSEDPDEMQHKAIFHQGLHCLLYINSSGTEIYIHNFKEMFTCKPLKYKMAKSIIIASICMG